jgi:hypothetical protein
MTLAAIGELIQIKRRPETVLEVTRALADPRGTVADYVFTDSLRHQFESMFARAELGRGQGYWIRAQYGGGKTHFLATIAALLSGEEDVWSEVADPLIAEWRSRLAGTRLFPVVFSLRGKLSVDPNAPLSLYDVFEDEIKHAAQQRLGIELRLSTADEVLAWWATANASIKGAINGWLRERTGQGADERLGDHDAFRIAVLDAVSGLNISIRLGAKTEERLQSAYRQVVNPGTGYTGILVIIDEFAFWQGHRPQNTPAGYQDEEFLETIGATLPQARDLQYTVIVASQTPPPEKLKDSQRYQSFDIVPGDSAAEQREYQQVVSHRVRQLAAGRDPEVDEYFEDAVRRYSFGAQLSRPQFRVMFPVEPTTYRILQRITSALAADRVGINVLWEVLASGDPRRPTVRPELLSRRRLVTPPLLLTSPSLELELTEPRHRERWGFRQAAFEGLSHCDLDEDERELAKDVLDTLFLWSVAQATINTPMPLEELTAAVLAEQGIYNSPLEAVESVLSAMDGLEQISFEKRTGTAEFIARGATGVSAQQIFATVSARPLQDAEGEWRKYLLDSQLGHSGLTALFAGKTPGSAEKITAIERGVEYEGRLTYADNWIGSLGAPLQRDEGFFRIVYLLRPLPELGAEAIQHDRVAVSIPADLTTADRAALQDVVALAAMEREYAGRDDDEALRVRNFVALQWPERAAELIRRQQERYRSGMIVTRGRLSIDPREVYQAPVSLNRVQNIAAPLLVNSFRERPFAPFKGPAPFAGLVPQWIFQALFQRDSSNRVVQAASAYAPALGLSDAADPTKLTGDHAPALALLRRWLKEADEGGTVLRTYDVYDRMAERGVPPRMTTLFLLAFVRRSSEQAELELGGRARVTVEGVPGFASKLRSADTPRITFTSVQDGTAFDVLRRSQAVAFGDAVPWLQAIDPEVRATYSPEEIGVHEDRVRYSADKLAGVVSQARAAAADVAELLGEVIPSDTADALDAAAALENAGGYAELYERARQHYETDEAFRAAISRVRAAEQLALNGSSIQGAIRYLKDLAGRLGDRDTLEVERKSLLARLNIRALLEDDVWPQTEPLVRQFKERYQTQYRKFHRDYMDEVRRLMAANADVTKRLAALERLDNVPSLRSGELVRLRQRWHAAAGGLLLCERGAAPPLEQSPVCEECHTPFNSTAPKAEFEALERDLAREWDRAVIVFRATAVQEALAKQQERGSGEARSLIEAIRLGSDHVVGFFADVPESQTLLQELFRGLHLSRVNVRDRLREKFPTVTAATLDEATAYFRETLAEALAEAGNNGEVELV